MPEFWKSTSNAENHAGFTITGSKLQVVEVVNRNEQYILENVDEAYFNEPINFENDKETKISALLQGAFNELLIRHPLKSSAASFTLPFELFYTMQVPFDNSLLHQDLVEEFKWELSVLYPFITPQELAIQYVEVDKNNLTDFNTAIVAAVPRKILQLLESFCKENNLKLKFVDNIHVASERALAISSPLMDKGLALSIYLGNKYLSLIFSQNGKPVRLKVIPLNDAGEIPALIQKEISPGESFRINRNMIDASFIAGEGLSASLVDTLRKNTKLEFIYFNPFEKIKPDQKLFDNKNISERSNSFSSAAGIAYRLA